MASPAKIGLTMDNIQELQREYPLFAKSCRESLPAIKARARLLKKPLAKVIMAELFVLWQQYCDESHIIDPRFGMPVEKVEEFISGACPAWQDALTEISFRLQFNGVPSDVANEDALTKLSLPVSIHCDNELTNKDEPCAEAQRFIDAICEEIDRKADTIDGATVELNPVPARDWMATSSAPVEAKAYSVAFAGTNDSSSASSASKTSGDSKASSAASAARSASKADSSDDDSKPAPAPVNGPAGSVTSDGSWCGSIRYPSLVNEAAPAFTAVPSKKDALRLYKKLSKWEDIMDLMKQPLKVLTKAKTGVRYTTPGGRLLFFARGSRAEVLGLSIARLSLEKQRGNQFAQFTEKYGWMIVSENRKSVATRDHGIGYRRDSTSTFPGKERFATEPAETASPSRRTARVQAIESSGVVDLTM
jgi:hypothetical protein